MTAEILFVLAIAATFLNVALLISLTSSVRGTGRSTTINIWYVLLATALWISWVVAR